MNIADELRQIRLSLAENGSPYGQMISIKHERPFCAPVGVDVCSLKWLGYSISGNLLGIDWARVGKESQRLLTRDS
jgi:hypothetical protein